MAKIDTAKYRRMTFETVKVGHNRHVTRSYDREQGGQWLAFTYHVSDVVTVFIPDNGGDCEVWVDAHEYFTTSTRAAIKDGLELFFGGYAGVSFAGGLFSVRVATLDATVRQDSGKCVTLKIGQHWLTYHKSDRAVAA